MADQWTEQDPGSVELGCMTSSMGELTAASSNYWSASADLATIKDSLADWVGSSSDAWRGSVDSLVSSVLASRDRILDGKAAISAYRNTTQSINNRAATAAGDLAAAEAIYSVPAPNMITHPVEYELWRGEQQMAQYHVQDARDEIYRLALERYAADDAAISALAGALPPDWSSTLTALASVGIANVGDLTRSTNADALLELAQRINAGDATGGDYDALALLLGMYEYNAGMMATLFEGLGGEGTVQLIDALGNDYGRYPETLGIAQQIRTGLSVLSATWDAGEAQDFTDAMFSTTAFGPAGDHFGVDQWAAIGFLFGDADQSPMGAEFSLSAAEAVDAIERLDQHVLQTSPVNWNTGGSALLLAENPGIEMIPGVAIQDVAGAVFQNLANHPEQALGFLAPEGNPGLGDDRVEYWFGDRDWSEPDGWESPGELWLGAVQAPGGPTAGEGPYDAAVDQRIAELASNVIPALSENGSFLSENISDDAAQRFAEVIGIQLDSISQFLVGVDGEYIIDGQSVFTYTVLGTDEVRYGAVFQDLDMLADVFGQVGAHTDAALTLSAAADLYEQSWLAFAKETGSSELVNEAMIRSNVLNGWMDGAGIGATVEQAAREDAELREHIEAVTGSVDFIAGLITVPVPGGYFIDQGIGIVSGIGTDFWADQWFANEQQYLGAVANAENWNEADQVFTTFQNASQLYETLNLTDSEFSGPPALDLTSLDAVDEARAWYESFYTSGAIDPNVYDLNVWDQAYETAYTAGEG